MGFYGSIINTQRTHFSFDKIYPSRVEMDAHAQDDTVFVGRYVLVDYDTNFAWDSFLTQTWLYQFEEGEEEVFYLASVFDKDEQLDLSQAENSKYFLPSGTDQAILIVKPGRHVVGKNPVNKIDDSGEDKTEFWKLVRKDAAGNYKATQLIGDEIPEEYKVGASSNLADSSVYIERYRQDYETYKENRGYDSTVWQKVHIGGKNKYVMIAELNTVVPTFDITYDAPSIVPNIPHFDEDSTNVYYKLHWQPHWGLRVKAAEDVKGKEINANTGETNIESEKMSLSLDTNSVKSDETVIWKNNFYDSTEHKYVEKYYDSEKEEWTAQEPEKAMSAAIYYNKDGFKSDIRSKDEVTQDKISVEPTGLSGISYETHSGDLEAADRFKPDTYELSILLPSLGNAISDVWDMVYGEKRNKNITWYDGDDENREERLHLSHKEKDAYILHAPEEVETLAGCINSVHDLMGMIVVDKTGSTVDSLNNNISDLSVDKIYYIDGKFYRKALKTVIAQDNQLNQNYYIDKDGKGQIVWFVGREDGAPVKEYVGRFPITKQDIEEKGVKGKSFYISVQKDPDHFIRDYYYLVYDNGMRPVTKEEYELSNTQYYYKKVDMVISYVPDNLANTYTIGTIWNENYDLPEGMKISYLREQYVLEELKGFATNYNTMHGILLRIAELLNVNDPYTRDASTLGGTYNLLRDLLKEVSVLSEPGFLMRDKEGALITKGYVDGFDPNDTDISNPLDHDYEKLLVAHNPLKVKIDENGEVDKSAKYYIGDVLDAITYALEGKPEMTDKGEVISPKQIGLCEKVKSIQQFGGKTISPIYLGDYITNNQPACCLRIDDFFYAFDGLFEAYDIAKTGNLQPESAVRVYNLKTNTIDCVARGIFNHANSAAYSWQEDCIYMAPTWDFTAPKEGGGYSFSSKIYVYNIGDMLEGYYLNPDNLVSIELPIGAGHAMGLSVDGKSQILYVLTSNKCIYKYVKQSWILVNKNPLSYDNSAYNQDFAVRDDLFLISSPSGGVLVGDLTTCEFVSNFTVSDLDLSGRWATGELEGFEFDIYGKLYCTKYTRILEHWVAKGFKEDLYNGFIMEIPLEGQPLPTNGITYSEVNDTLTYAPLGDLGNNLQGENWVYYNDEYSYPKPDSSYYYPCAQDLYLYNNGIFYLHETRIRNVNQLRTIRTTHNQISFLYNFSRDTDIIINQDITFSIRGTLKTGTIQIRKGELNIYTEDNNSSENSTYGPITDLNKHVFIPGERSDNQYKIDIIRNGRFKLSGDNSSYPVAIGERKADGKNNENYSLQLNIGYYVPLSIFRYIPQNQIIKVGSTIATKGVYYGSSLVGPMPTVASGASYGLDGTI